MEETIQILLETWDQDYLLQYYDSLKENENDRKAAMERMLKTIFKQILMADDDGENFNKLLDLLIVCVQQDMLKCSLVFISLSDMFDACTLHTCDLLFKHVEEKIQVWKSEAFYAAGKNFLLRTCNDLLKRLSRSQNTIFSGRIQLFLANLFSIEEKSGLNLMSNFNTDNVTSYTTSTQDTEKMVDVKLHKRFWSLQDFFRLPSQCYDLNSWKLFVQCAEEVLSCFKSFKLDSASHSTTHPSTNNQTTFQNNISNLTSSHTTPYSFFPKFLTNQKLLDLQLNDSNFRRYILVQHLITFQYLTASVKFKQSHQNLTDDQINWIKNTTDKVYDLISETPPNGKDFVLVVKHVLNREENWNRWKNEGCVSRKLPLESTSDAASIRRKRKSLGEDMHTSKVVKMGHPELTRLWNLCPDNNKACVSTHRNFERQPAVFLHDAILQLQPENAIEDVYKSINDPVFSWKSMRLMTRCSSSFFQANQSKDIKTVSQYLESMLLRMQRETPIVHPKPESNNEEVASNEDNDENEVSNHSPSGCSDEGSVEEMLVGMGEEWRKLGEIVGVDGELLDEMSQKTLSSREACIQVLEHWKSISGEVTTDMVEEAMHMMTQSTGRPPLQFF